jgi:hypothetical protein
MIDNPNQTGRLIEKLRSSLPIAAVMTPESFSMFCKETGEQRLSARCLVKDIHYGGDEGGIVCGLDVAGNVGKRGLYISITHLRFDPRAPFAREIIAYQKHRAKRLRRTGETLQQA